MDEGKRACKGAADDARAARPASSPAFGETRTGYAYSAYGAQVGSPDTHIGHTQPIPVRKGLFDGISVAQVIAASAAAATSMLLASHIGIAGSVIGAAVSSMVTVICSQLYRNALDASARKLKAKQVDHASEQDALRGYANAGGASDAAGSSATGAPRIRIAPTKLQARAAAERSASRRKVAIASALIALAAVAVSAGVIMLTTSGEGLGTKAPGIFVSAPAETDPVDEATQPVDPAAAASDSTGPNEDAAQTPETPVGGGDVDEGTSSGTGTQNDGSASQSTPSDGTAQQNGESSGTQGGQQDASESGDTGTSTDKKPATGDTDTTV